jgi:single-strand DNA-binding protein
MNKGHINGTVKDIKAGEKFSTATIEVTNPDGKTKSFQRLIAFGKAAEALKEGAAMVEGRIQTGSYTNKDGQKVYTTDVVATSVQKSNATIGINDFVEHGRLTRDVSVKEYTGKDGTTSKVTRGTIAVDRRGKTDGPTADFIGFVAFGKTAEFMEKYLHKGSEVVIDGRLQSGSYNAKDGTKVYTNDLVVNSVEFAGPKAAAPATTAETAEPVPADADGFVPVEAEYEGDGLPFN